MRKTKCLLTLMVLMFITPISVQANEQKWLAPAGWVEAWTGVRVQGANDDLDPDNDSKGNAWFTADYDDSEWTEVTGGIGQDPDRYHTYWADENSANWVRRKFTVEELPINDCLLAVDHDDACRIYLNGTLIYENDGCRQNDEGISFDKSLLKTGENIIAAYVNNGGGDSYLDFGIYLKPFEFKYNNIAISIGQEYSLVSNYTNQDVINSLTWESSDDSYISVKNGVVTGLKEGMAIISAYSEDRSTNCSCNVYCIPNQSPLSNQNGHDYVDMGLSVMWSTTIVGAKNETTNNMQGCRYPWGEYRNETEMYGSWERYKYAASETDLYKYCINNDWWAGNGNMDNLTELQPEDDAAQIAWGEGWRTPSDEEFAELFSSDNTIFTRVDDYKGTGCSGFIIKSKVTGYKGNYIFLQGGLCNCIDSWGTGYWTRNLNLNECFKANIYQIWTLGDWEPWDMGRGCASSECRHRGCLVRAVYSDAFLTHINVSSIELDKTSLTLSKGQSYTLTTTVLPENATDKSITWSSSSPSDVYISDGMVICLTGGASIITATANDGSGVIAQCYVNCSKDFAIIDGNAYSNSKDEDYETITYTRTYDNTNWQALYVPFAMNYADWCDDYDVAAINNFHQADTDDDGVFDQTSLEIIKVKSGNIYPNHPYLIRAKQTGEQTISIKDATLKAAATDAFTCSSMNTNYTFKGTYSEISGAVMLAQGYYAIGNGTLHQAESAENSLKPYRWYLQLQSRDGQTYETPANIRIQVMGEDDETAVEGIIASSNNDKPYYDLSGRLVQRPTKGIYLHDGKKVYVK